MKQKVSHYQYIIFSVLVVIASCAKVSSPTGGPKDLDPPFMVKSEPVNGQTNFRGNKITITFNEFVSLKNVNEKFMVSPPLAKRPQISIKGKSVVVEYDEELHDSSTYTFYFQDAICDLNESNPINNFQFVFSTGDVIDSLTVTGNVLSAFSLDPPENTLVMLFKDLSDSAFIKKLPDYITRISNTGYFRIDNIKEGIYRLYALKDADNSKNFNLADEEIAFFDSLIYVTAEKNFIPVPEGDSLKAQLPSPETADTAVIKGDYQLLLFKPRKKTHYLTSSSRDMQYKLVYTLSLPPDTIGFDFNISGADSSSWFIETSREKDTVTVWITDSALYSQPQLEILAGYPFTDSLGKTVRKQDTILHRYMAPRAPRGRTRPTPLNVTSGFSKGSLIPGQDIYFVSGTPLRYPDTSRLHIYELRDNEQIKIPFIFKMDENNVCRLKLLADLQQARNYLFVADSAAFGNIYGLVTDSIGTRFIVRNDDTFGKLILNINNFEGKRIVQLLDSKDKILREVKSGNEEKVEFQYLDKGTYRLRVIYDLNGDGKWTTGDFLTRLQPEPVSFYPRDIPINENHWVDQDWDIGIMNEKKLKKETGLRSGRK